MLRDYQIDSIELVKKEFSKGYKKTMLVLPTGSGKSVVACEMIKKAVERGTNVIFAVRGVSLINQISRTLFKEQVDHGVMQGSHWNRKPSSKVQVVSIDTIIKRKNFPKAEFIIIDEVDQATSNGYKEFLSMYPDAYVLGVTATPYFTKSIRHAADSYIKPITMEQLIEKNYLCPFRYFAPNTPDLSSVKISRITGDYDSLELESVMTKGALTGKIIDHWIAYGENRPTLVFGINVRHSKLLRDKFIKAGIPAEHCDANTPQEERDSVFAKLKSGELKIVCNVGIATRGFDAPFVSCLVIARPTKSLNLHIQILGRGTRLSPETGKSNCLVIDHAGNLEKLGFPTDEHEIDLDAKKKESHTKKSKICKECFAVFREDACPSCGTVPEKKDRKFNLEEADEELKELTERDLIRMTHNSFIKQAKKTGKKKWWAHYKLVNKYGIEKAKEFLPDRFVENYENGTRNVFASSWAKPFIQGG